MCKLAAFMAGGRVGECSRYAGDLIGGACSTG